MNEDGRRVVVVLGCTGIIGQSVAHALAREDVRLVLTGRNKDRVTQLAQDLGAQARVLDAAEMSHIDACFHDAYERYGRVDGAVNCTGSHIHKPAHLTSENDLRSVIDANLTSAFGMVRAAARVMTRGASMVLLSSAAAQAGFANHDAIGAAKAGVEGLVRSAAATYAPRGIRINAVAPGVVEGSEAHKSMPSDTYRAASLMMHPLARFGQADEIADAVAWLLSPRQGWITGQVLGVDGGLAAIRG